MPQARLHQEQAKRDEEARARAEEDRKRRQEEREAADRARGSRSDRDRDRCLRLITVETDRSLRTGSMRTWGQAAGTEPCRMSQVQGWTWLARLIIGDCCEYSLCSWGMICGSHFGSPDAEHRLVYSCRSRRGRDDYDRRHERKRSASSSDQNASPDAMACTRC